MRNERGASGFAVLVIVAVLAAVVGIGALVYQTSIKTTERTNCLVTDKDRTSKSDGGSDARIYTDNCGTLKVADATFKGKFNSADTYSAIKVGKVYDFTTTGFRAGILSEFPNIIEATPVG